MRLLIRPLMSRPRPASKLHSGPEKWIFNAFEVNNLPRKMTRTSKIMKKISFPRILLLMHHQIGPNPLRHSLKRTKTVVSAKENPDNKAKARIFLPLALMPPLSGRTKTKIRIRKIYPSLSGILVSRKVIMLITVPKKCQKTSVGLDDLYIGN